MSQAVLTAVCRRDATAGAAWAREYGVAFHPTPAALVGDPAVDAVLVVTPTQAHAGAAELAFAAHKPVLIEKPLAPTAEAARAIACGAEQAGVPCMVAQTLRREPVFARLRERIVAQSAKPRVNYQLLMDSTGESLRGSRASDGAASRLIEIGVHVLDWLASLPGVDSGSLCCVTDAPPPHETRVHALLESHGVTAQIEIGHHPGTRYERVTVQVGEELWCAERFRRALWRWCADGFTTPIELPEVSTIALILKEFASCVQAGAAVPIPAREGVRGLVLAEAALASAASGAAPVRFQLS